ncbi:hypothetical protein FDF74_08380 [Clostridium niameyense]|uniref:Lipoprotein n=1 Tax=Clostridium niameyense TaxID=1622073 RepID=A0A6M0RAD5_9CLOT|nr:hypothetical protein [Clostridium niameyense]NEZ47224.1 hypothetical protein [Clostridium niameyense]
MKKILSILMVLTLTFGLVACGSKTSKTTDNKPKETKQEIAKDDKETKQEIDKDKKEDLKNKIQDTLKDREVVSIDIFTFNNGEPKASIQLKDNILKADIKKDEATELCKKIGEKIKPICSKYDIELIDKDNQLNFM